MTTVDTVLKNCRIVTTTHIIDADIAIDQGKITKVARSAHMPRADKVIDVKGRIVIPGVIDPHVHFREPGFTHKEDFASGSRAAAYGGVTTVFDMPNTKPRTDSASALELKRRIVARTSYVDYAFYAEITNENAASLPAAFAYKAYLDHDKLSYASLQKALRALQNKVVCVHAEDYRVIKKGKYTKKPESHSAVRGPKAETTAIESILKLDFESNHVHFCHVSTGEGLALIKNSGKKASCETAPHYLLLSVEDYKRLGAYLKVNPAIKSRDNADMLWAGLGGITCMGSDHAPHTHEEKEQSVEKAPSGLPGVETMLSLLINEVNRGTLTWNELVRLTSHGQMQIFGLKSKGEIAVGKDADLVVIDNAREWTIVGEALHSKCGWTPYEGKRVRGSIEKVFLRGELLLDNGEFKGRKGQGEEYAYSGMLE